jgi:hypothetical protein
MAWSRDCAKSTAQFLPIVMYSLFAVILNIKNFIAASVVISNGLLHNNKQVIVVGVTKRKLPRDVPGTGLALLCVCVSRNHAVCSIECLLLLEQHIPGGLLLLDWLLSEEI